MNGGEKALYVLSSSREEKARPLQERSSPKTMRSGLILIACAIKFFKSSGSCWRARSRVVFSLGERISKVSSRTTR